ncbi:MAG: hypothetical protein A2136_08110 [Chloroflexi bacterium RBG_16_54_11]|nr:MAG: hypothetical protein A2136_08110 [Chloroflexi bacterium RBG_16_54_11]
MNLERQIDQIIQNHVHTISMGGESLESVVSEYPQIAKELRPRLEAAVWLRQARFAMATRPGYVHDSRKYLESKIESLQPHGFWKQILRRYTPQRLAFNIITPVVLVLLIAFVVNSAILTARLSIPGDPLYGAKLVIEDVRMAFTFGQAGKTSLHIQYSRERLLEFTELVMEGEYEQLPASALRMEREIIASLRSLNGVPSGEGTKNHQLVRNFKETLSNEIVILNVLKTTSPTNAYPQIELAINTVQSGLFALR